MRRETKAERRAWSEYFGDQVQHPSKFLNEREGKYQSRHEAEVAAKLAALERGGKIKNLKEQVRIVLVPGDGKLRPVTYIADFAYEDEHGFHVLDAKSGFTAKLPIYRLKKRLAALLLGLSIEEV